MRINDKLEKSLLQLEQEETANVVSLLDIAKAFEEVYKFINTYTVLVNLTFCLSV